MTHPSAKTEFSNDNLSKVMTTLINKGHRVEFDPNNYTLSVYGDLKTDIDGLGSNLVVYNGDIFSNVLIDHELTLTNIKSNDHSSRKIILDDTKIKAYQVHVGGNGMTDIYGHGDIIARRYVSAKNIHGQGRGLKINAGRIDGYDEISGVIEGYASKGIESKVIVGPNARLFTASSHIGEITKGALLISGNTHVRQITNGAKVFSYGELRCEIFGGHDVDDTPVMVVANDGFKEKQFRMGGIYAHNAMMFSPDKSIFDDVQIMSIGDKPRPTILTDTFNGLPEDMIDFIRLGYDTMKKHTKAPMPENVSREIHKRFALA